MGKDTIGRDVLAFLAGNLLDPTPMNYRFGYLYLTRSSKVICEETDTYVENGMRMKQETIVEIMGKHASASDDPEERIAARDEAIEMFLHAAGDLARETKRQAHGVGRDIAEESQVIRDGAQGEDLKGAIRRIIDRADEAERELSTASSRIDRLQRDLDEARNKALIDELTGIPNRRATRATIQDLEIRKVRYCVSIIDIDHFKAINDTYGHAVGDRALRLVAEALTEALAPWPVARWGGEEFLVIAETPDANRVAQQVAMAKDALAERNLKLRETDEPMGAITFSAGVSVSLETSDATLCRADDALYEAKKTGRNKVIVAPEKGRIVDAA
ncbi:GGDEF domain-containing protein [Alteriqipengyuania lutimaris]|uniref:diguanylate cyclase n=1 Tax=Alteriqipengyuania lutimaris TaxID=1538146 RepID=A0A395LLE5_9SPHN|nr:GGDEF domain-containing protein [Alteriqipengyuania lutimaris]MBB3034916.1 diguanylate cyclase [Alteriqipengyuania lutimaris]RDS76254.1 GGDEF domain-containing protein [Alteriqipengyuania lutimaris]